MRIFRVEFGAQLGQAVERQLCVQLFRKRADDRPVLARIARREDGALRHLHPAFGIDVGGAFFGIGGARQDDVGKARAAIAMAALIHDESVARLAHIQFVRAEQIEQFDVAVAGTFQHRVEREPALLRHETEIEPADARRRIMQYVEAVPALIRLAAYSGFSRPGPRDARSPRRRNGQPRLGPGSTSGRSPSSAPPRRGACRDDVEQRLRTRAEIVIFIGEVGRLADHADLQPSAAPALRMRAFSTAASWRGLLPTSSSASASSSPAIVELNI